MLWYVTKYAQLQWNIFKNIIIEFHVIVCSESLKIEKLDNRFIGSFLESNLTVFIVFDKSNE